MIQKFGFKTSIEKNVIRIAISGYLDKEGSESVKSFLDQNLKPEIRGVIIDFSATEVINSPGAATLVGLATKTVDERDLPLAAFGLNSHHLAILEMAGFFFFATQAQDEKSAWETIEKHNA